MAAEIPDGCVVVARAIFNSSLWTMRDQDRILAITLIGLANWRDRKWFDGEHEITIARGQLVRSQEELAEASRLSRQTLRTSLRNLENVGFLTRNPTKRYTIFTLPKYAFYQNFDNYSDSAILKSTQGPTTHQPGVNHDPTKGQPRANHKQEGEEGKEGKERKEGEEEGVSGGPTDKSSSPSRMIAAAYIRVNPGMIAQDKATKIVEFYVARGLNEDAANTLMLNAAAIKGKKIWEVLDSICPNGNGLKEGSIERLKRLESLGLTPKFNLSFFKRLPGQPP